MLAEVCNGSGRERATCIFIVIAGKLRRVGSKVSFSGLFLRRKVLSYWDLRKMLFLHSIYLQASMVFYEVSRWGTNALIKEQFRAPGITTKSSLTVQMWCYTWVKIRDSFEDLYCPSGWKHSWIIEPARPSIWTRMGTLRMPNAGFLVSEGAEKVLHSEELLR